MIVRDHLPLRRVWPVVSRRLGWLFLYDTTIALIFTSGVTVIGMSSLPLGLMGAALSIFLAFRNNSAYDRWWEARTLWGGLVNDSRTFGRQALTLVDEPPASGNLRTPASRPSSAASAASTSTAAAAQGAQAHAATAPPLEAMDLIEWQIAYVHALRCHLRQQTPYPELTGRLSPALIGWLRTQRNVPLALLLHAGRMLRSLFDQGRMDSFRFTQMDSTLSRLCDVQGACERIKNTPLPRQYEFVPRMLVGAYCLLLPLGLVEGMGLMTPLASTLVSFIFVSLDSIGRDIEAPFENTVHDTPMSQLSRTIEINLRETVGDDNVPGEVRPIDGFVY
jgi:ion channel-forming bestrophin family protein